jgi:hypothetical protein
MTGRNSQEISLRPRFFLSPQGHIVMTTAYGDLSDTAALVGKRVKLRPSKWFGSVRVLNGLTGTVIAPHPIAPRWVKLQLDPNQVTPYKEWTVPQDWLVIDEYA